MLPVQERSQLMPSAYAPIAPARAPLATRLPANPVPISAYPPMPYEEPGPERDLLRESPLRYVGYSNEVTETGKAAGVRIARAMNPLGWGLTFGYGILDAFNRAMSTQQKELKAGKSTAQAERTGQIKFGEGLFFHTIATWLGPIFLVIKPVYKITDKILHKKFNHVGPLPAFAALASIGIAPKLLDPVAEHLVDTIYQPLTEPLKTVGLPPAPTPAPTFAATAPMAPSTAGAAAMALRTAPARFPVTA